MPKSDDRFRVTVTFNVEKVDQETGEVKPWAKTEQVYAAMRYERLVEVQEEVLGTLVRRLLDKGVEAAKAIAGKF